MLLKLLAILAILILIVIPLSLPIGKHFANQNGRYGPPPIK